jgi:Holliday junction resolvase RusA-like endonuclease
VHIKVHGIAAPQGSKTRGGNGQMREVSRALPAWREAIRAETQREIERWHGGKVAFTGAVEVTVEFALQRPRSHWRTRGGEIVDELRLDAPLWPVGKPDRDKLLRAVMDGITAGGALSDDSIAICGDTRKEYAAFGQPAGCDVWIDALRPAGKFTVSDPAREAIAAARASGAIAGG